MSDRLPALLSKFAKQLAQENSALQPSFQKEHSISAKLDDSQLQGQQRVQDDVRTKMFGSRSRENSQPIPNSQEKQSNQKSSPSKNPRIGREPKWNKETQDSFRRINPQPTQKENGNNFLSTPKFTPSYLILDEAYTKTEPAPFLREDAEKIKGSDLSYDLNPYQPPSDKYFESYVASEFHRKMKTVESPLETYNSILVNLKSQNFNESTFQQPSSDQVLDEPQHFHQNNSGGHGTPQENPYQRLKREFLEQIAPYLDSAPKTQARIQTQKHSKKGKKPSGTHLYSAQFQSMTATASLARDYGEIEKSQDDSGREYQNFTSVKSDYHTPEKKSQSQKYGFYATELENSQASFNHDQLLMSPIKKVQDDEREESESEIQVKEFSEATCRPEMANYGSVGSKFSMPIPFDQISITQEDLLAKGQPSPPKYKHQQNAALNMQLNLVSMNQRDNDSDEIDTESVIVRSRYLVDDRRWRNEELEAADQLELEGFDQFERNDFQAALEAFSKSLVISQNHFGRDNLRVARLLHKIGYVFAATGKLAVALSCYHESLELTKKHSGNDELSTAELLQNIGNIYFQRGLPMKAKQHYCESLNIKLKKFGEAHPEIAELMINVANVMKMQGRLDEALIIYERGLKILQKNSSSGEDLANESVALNNLAVTLMELKRFKQSLACFERCLKLKKEIHGENHPQIGNVLTNMGNVLFQMGDFEEALVNYQKSFKVKQMFYDSSHKDIKRTLENIRLVKSKLGEASRYTSLRGIDMS